MKNFVLITLLAFFSIAYTVDVQAQAVPLISTTNSTAIDTVINAGVRTQRLALAGYQDNVSIVSTVTKISGTLGGTIKCYGSLDNTNWVLVDANTFTVTDVATQSYEWKITPSRFAYYEIIYTGVTGPMSAKLSTKMLGRKK